MTLPTLFRWHRGHRVPVRREASPLSGLGPGFDRLFDELMRGFELAPFGTDVESASGFAPRLDVTETDKEVRVTAELPGLEAKDFELDLHGDVLTIKGEKRVETEDKGRGYSERAYGTFHRTIQLPTEVDVDKVSADYRNGVLTVTLPKPPEASEQSRRIEVKSS